MIATPISSGGSVAVIDYRCDRHSIEPPFVELHGTYSVSYVRKGSFGYSTRGRSFEMVAGSILIGRPADEFVCTHDHHAGGDECLSFHLAPELVDAIDARSAVWGTASLPPLP